MRGGGVSRGFRRIFREQRSWGSASVADGVLVYVSGNEIFGKRDYRKGGVE